ncbi:uncharacterized protein [Pleurodeles waltl]|uniref:uncharacterized protein isoform X5 n=1 Tax=Pleurodeles waltl TaxID=8319 RepID=UPI003709B119
MKSSSGSVAPLALLILCTVGPRVLGADPAGVVTKPGMCPKDTIICVQAEKDQCKNDDDCTGKQKCCNFQCGLKCKAPETEKPGQCPVPSTRCAAPPPPPTCKKDSECPGSQKCCTPVCTQECTNITIAVTKPGMCPKDTIVCVQAEKNQCKNDDDCTGKQKCCYFQCGLKCKAPETEKPGQCPVPSTRCATPLPARCKQDSECPGSQKCCTPVCTQECTNITAEKPGQCPVPSTRCAAPPPPPTCKKDSECPGSQKCCTPVCTQECTNITAVKAGACPKDTVVCKKAEPDQCKIDRDCSGTQRCCYFQCGLKCKDPATEKPGECPVPATMCAAPAPPPRCKQDSECPGSQKCCTPVCTQECTNITIVSEKPGLCPSPPSYPTCRTFPNPPKNACTTDQQCLGDEKCCEYGCKLQCKKPLQDKVGSCPAFNRSICLFARPAPAECSSDSQCPGTQRCCCHGNCRMECAEAVSVKPGTCPPKPPKCNLQLPAQQCKDDSDCGGKKKCCSHCGIKCMDPIGNSGFCPLDLEKEKQCGYLPPPRCSSDAQCKADEKCCLFGCGEQCVKALPVKPGMCPAILAKCVLPLGKPECQDDGDCPLNKKCCQLCGNKCLEPATDHAGVCPSYIIRKPLICPAVLTFSCRHDWNCNADEKCCNVGCQRKCVKALPEKMGVCPRVPLVTNLEDICHKCNNDKDCPGIERCCAGPKGRQCRPPTKFVGLPIPVEAPDS